MLQIDKTYKLTAVSPEKYLVMGSEHTKGDIEVDWSTCLETKGQVARHTAAWVNMLGVGKT